jgi:ABC-2 type transport system permease protein
MFWEFFRFDLKLQLRAPFLWIGAVLFALLAFGATCSDAVRVGGSIGNVYRNAPVVIIQFLLVFSILGMLVLASTIAGGLLRDFELGTAELFFATPMRKFNYLFGRFSAAILCSLALFVMIVLGMMLGTKMPWLEPQRLGPMTFAPYLWALAVVVLPNLILMGALLSLLAVTTRSMLMVYLGLLAFLTLWVIAGVLTRDVQNEWIASLLDPFCARAFARTIRYWSAAERNTLVPPLNGFILANRALWTGLGIAMLAATHALFRPQTGGTSRAWFRRSAQKSAKLAAPAAATVERPVVQPAFGTIPTLLQFFKQARFDAKSVLLGVPFLVMLAFGVLNMVGSASVMGDMFGTKVYPVTYLLLDTMRSSYNFLLILVATFYAGELIWKERGAKVAEVTDAMPVPDWVPLAAKLAALMAVVFGFMLCGALTGMVFQLFKGYTHLEAGLYLKGALLESVPFMLMGSLALVLQVLANNKFLGYLVLILFLVSQIVMGALHFDHNLYSFAGAPAATYSDMNGFGHALAGCLWFQFYWALFTGLLGVLAILFWVRGTAQDFRIRLARAKARIRGPLVAGAACLGLGFACSGIWIFYNTNTLNHYIASDKSMDRQARYEKTYRQYKGLPQPRITEVKADVDIYPEERRVQIRGHYRLVNKTAQPIPDFHVIIPNTAVVVEKLSFVPAELKLEDKETGYHIYHLKEPMAPAAAMDFDFDLRVEYRGFTNDGNPAPIRRNGTFFNSMQYFPAFGYQEAGQLVDRSERRKRGLGDVPRMAKLEDESARGNTYIANDADWIQFESTVTTSADQIALCPGYLLDEHVKDGRRSFHYKMDSPMMPFFAYLSARWQVKRDAWKGIPIEIYYDAKHPRNVERMITAVKKSLDYYTKNFSPYQHRQVRILEFPRYETFAQSFANTIPYSESIGFIADLRDQDSIDYVFYVTAHEMAHQWWAHQVIGANVQGSTMLSESLAQYSALMVMEKEYGREKMRRFLKYELDGYLRDRAGELVEELPLERVEDQGYIHYHKGSLVFYRLREEIGEETLNHVLASFIEAKAFQQPPYTTSREFLECLRKAAPADRQGLITDLFEKIVFYDNRVSSAQATKRPDGKYEVELQYEARKFQADGKGVETPLPLDDWMEVGVFARKPGEPEARERVLALQRQHVTQPKGRFTFVVDAQPYEAGIDPYNKLIDRVSSDNRKTISIK